MSYTAETITKSAFSVFDMMLRMQRIGLQAITMYEPITSAYLDAVMASQSVGLAAVRGWSVGTSDSPSEQVTGIADDVPKAATDTPQAESVSVRRVAEEAPLPQDVTRHTETAAPADGGAMAPTGGDALPEATAEATDFNAGPVAAEAVLHPVEEVPPPEETIHDTVKRDEPEIEAPAQEPAAFDASEKQEEQTTAVETLNETETVAPVGSETQPAETH